MALFEFLKTNYEGRALLLDLLSLESFLFLGLLSLESQILSPSILTSKTTVARCLVVVSFLIFYFCCV